MTPSLMLFVRSFVGCSLFILSIVCSFFFSSVHLFDCAFVEFEFILSFHLFLIFRLANHEAKEEEEIPREQTRQQPVLTRPTM